MQLREMDGNQWKTIDYGLSSINRQKTSQVKHYQLIDMAMQSKRRPRLRSIIFPIKPTPVKSKSRERLGEQEQAELNGYHGICVADAKCR